MIKTK